MITTSNMGLTAWSSLTDNFNHTQLANNFIAIDAHDHTTSHGVQIPAGGLAALAVSTAKLQDGAVTSAKLASPSVATANLTDLNVTGAKLANATVTYDKIGALPGARVYSSSAFSVPNATLTAVSFNTSRFNNSATWAVGNPTRLTAAATGVYMITGHAHWASSAAGSYRHLTVRLNGSSRITGQDRAGTVMPFRHSHVAAIYRLSAGDYVELCVQQDSGGALNLESVENASPEFAMMWLSL